MSIDLEEVIYELHRVVSRVAKFQTQDCFA